MATIRINEVGPRDGLQNEKVAVPTDVKVAYIDALSETGVDEIEVSAFVSPKWVPQLADAEDVLSKIRRRAGVVYGALVPNERGLDRAQACQLDKISVFTATSETFTQKNVNTSIEGSMKRFEPVVERALAMGLRVRGYISTSFWCPYEGKMHPDKTLDLTQRLLGLGAQNVAISDTIGRATPDEVRALLDVVLSHIDAERIALHFHDTYGNAPANVQAAYEMGITAFDSSAGGIGGCPYAPGARGNIGTEVLVQTIRGMGGTANIDLDALARARAVIGPSLGRGSEDAALPVQGDEEP